MYKNHFRGIKKLNTWELFMKFDMQKNIGETDRLIRIILGIILLLLAYYYGSLILFLIALFLFFEAWKRWCVLYQIFGKNTYSKKKK